MKTTEIRELSTADLKERIETTKTQLARDKFNHTVSPIENQSLIKKTRRDIARMLTVLRQKDAQN